MTYFDDLQFVCHGEIAVEPNRYLGRHFDYWTIQYSQHGSVELQIGGGETETYDGACAFVTFPGPVFNYGPATGKTLEHKIFLGFCGDRVRRWIAGGLLRELGTQAILPVSDGASLRDLLRRIRSLLILPEAPEHHAHAVMLLEEALLELRTRPRRLHLHNDRLFPACEELTGRIAAQPGHSWNFEKEARKLGISYAHFRRVFRDFFGTPPGAYLLESRIQQAALLLTHTDAPVRAIAAECGFADEFYFSRIFKKHRRLSPKSYRETFRND